MAEIEILTKLFDTLKDQMKDLQVMSQAILTNLNSIGNYIKHLPMEELRESLKEHSKESSDEIENCTETVETKTDNILEKVNIIESRVSRMILVVVVAFSLLSGAYLFGRYSMDDNKKFNEWKKKITEEQNQDHKNLRKEVIETIRKELRKK